MENELLNSLIGTHGEFRISQVKLDKNNSYRLIAHQHNHCYHVRVIEKENEYLLTSNVRKDELLLHMENRRTLMNEIQRRLSEHPKVRLLIATGVVTFSKKLTIQK